MKYGETLRQRSIAAWSHHNIDYDDIKYYIKEQTTAGKGKSVSIPGRNDEKPQQFENSLLAILTDQHDRIGLFVKSKAGEIRNRLDHSKRQLRQLSARNALTADQRIPVARIERYGRLENDVLKAGDEVKSLARFTSAQRTAIRKLLKKYKKWTGSTQLEDRFRAEVLDNPKSFTKLDLGPLLDDYSTTLQQIRTLYESRIESRATPDANAKSESSFEASVIPGLQFAIESGSKVEFDTAVATVPLGEKGTFASYFVHSENVVELQILLLQHMRYFLSRSRSNSVTTPVSPSPTSDHNAFASSSQADYHALEADDPERLAEESSSLTVAQREHGSGSSPQKARVCVRWNPNEDAQVTFRPHTNKCQYARVKRKYVAALVDKDAAFSPTKAAATPEGEQLVGVVRRGIEQERNMQPISLYSSCRSRFVGTTNSSQRSCLATLDTHITTQMVSNGAVSETKHGFPFALLLVRQEGTFGDGLLPTLDQTHLVERVPGFSFEYHALWQTHRSARIPAPFWLPILERDIRKLPPPAMKRALSSNVSRTPNSEGSGSVPYDSTTAVETTRSNSIGGQASELEAPQIRSFRKKRRTRRPKEAQIEVPSRYWSEYDHPEDGDGADAYVIYIDPNQKSSITHFLDRIGNIFAFRKPSATINDTEPLLLPPTPKESESSSSEDDSPNILPPSARPRSYGTLRTIRELESTTPTTTSSPSCRNPPSPPISPICYTASLALLTIAYLLSATGKKKLRYEVDFGVLLAVGTSLFFAIVGFAGLLRRGEGSYWAWTAGVVVVVVDVVGSAGLLVWMLG